MLDMVELKPLFFFRKRQYFDGFSQKKEVAHCWNLLSVARKPTRVNSVDNRVTRAMANSSINQASHGHCAGVFIGT
jgi:hypothetical protein